MGKNYKKTLNSARLAVPHLKIMRSCQLDSIIIDKEIYTILKELFLKIFEVYKIQCIVQVRIYQKNKN